MNIPNRDEENCLSDVRRPIGFPSFYPKTSLEVLFDRENHRMAAKSGVRPIIVAERNRYFLPKARCLAKKSCRICRHSVCMTPAVTKAWWFNRGSLVISYNEWQAPALGSAVP
jgi:hypothetical protein